MVTRREWLRQIGTAAAMPMVGAWLPPELADWGRDVHAAAQAGATGLLDAELMRTLSVTCERIIPTDETPGAVAAGVPRFIDHMLTGWYDASEQQRVAAGLQDLQQQARTRFGLAFVDATAAQQDALLLDLDALGAQSWFATVKYLTIWGYYTSEVGVTQELQQGRSPGRYDGCAPYAPRTRAAVQADATSSLPERRHAAR
jgi:gluconate 2-dehydrogenase gamma chain